MEYIKEESKNIPVILNVDVIVLGAGPAGFSAALSAAREGCKTLIIEQSSDIGGVATTGLMSHFTGATEGPIYNELLEASYVSYNESLKDITQNEHLSKNKTIINHEILKNKMIEMLEMQGVIIKLYTMAIDVIMLENKLKGIIIESKNGREAISSKIVIDCTGDGDIAFKSGAEFILGRESDSLMQPMTLMFQVSSVDLKKIQYIYGFEQTYNVPLGDIQLLAKQFLEEPMGHVLIYPSVFPNTVTLNMTNCSFVNGTNADDLTKGYISCRKQMPKILEFLKKYVPGFENAFIIKTASQIGVRETRHFKGLETITEEDIASARVFDNWVATKCHFNFDVHNLTGSGLDETGSQKTFTQKKGYTIPYGCFVPEKIDNLLLAGRNISGTHLAHSNYRVMPICINMGQGVGVAASICVKENIFPRNLDIKKLQNRLIELGITP